MCSVGSTSLTNTQGVESYHSNFSSHVYPNWSVNWVDVGGGWLQSGIRAGFVLFRWCLVFVLLV